MAEPAVTSPHLSLVPSSATPSESSLGYEVPSRLGQRHRVAAGDTLNQQYNRVRIAEGLVAAQTRQVEQLTRSRHCTKLAERILGNFKEALGTSRHLLWMLQEQARGSWSPYRCGSSELAARNSGH